MTLYVWPRAIEGGGATGMGWLVGITKAKFALSHSNSYALNC